MVGIWGSSREGNRRYKYLIREVGNLGSDLIRKWGNKYKRRREENKIIVRVSEKNFRNSAINYLKIPTTFVSWCINVNMG